jgi:hypothetical protein
MDILFTTEEEEATRKLTALQQLLHRLPREAMLRTGKTCIYAYNTTKKVHEARVIQAFSKYLYCGPTTPGQLRKGLVLPLNAFTNEPNVFYPHQIRAAIDVVGSDVDLEWDDRDVTKFLFWTMGSVPFCYSNLYLSTWEF